jgi:hypothetical protein
MRLSFFSENTKEVAAARGKLRGRESVCGKPGGCDLRARRVDGPLFPETDWLHTLMFGFEDFINGEAR